MYRKLVFDNIFKGKIKKLLSGGGFKLNEAGKLAPANPRGSATSPWVFTNYDARRKYCNWWNGIYCGEFGLIPSFCRFNCWKTVVYPNNLLETFILHDILRVLNLPSKCGVDRRNYTYRAWGGYIYGDTLEQGKKYYSLIRKAVDKSLGSHVDIILKRGCTEMERLKPSDTWDNYSDEEKALELQVDDIFSFSEQDFRQSAFMVREIKEYWVLRAIETRDPTAEEVLKRYGNGIKLSDLIVKSVTYHEDAKLKEVKQNV